MRVYQNKLIRFFEKGIKSFSEKISFDANGNTILDISWPEKVYNKGFLKLQDKHEIDLYYLFMYYT